MFINIDKPDFSRLEGVRPEPRRFPGHHGRPASLLASLIVVIMTLTFGPVFGQVSADYTWKSVAFGGGGFVTGIITCPAEQDLIYVRTDVGGAYRWNAPEGSWIPLLDWADENEMGYMGVESIAVDPQSPNRVYLLAGTSYFNAGKTAILRSTNYGGTFDVINVTAQFKAHGNGMGRQNGERLAVDPNQGNIIFTGTRRNGLFKSTNRGSTWTKITAFPATTTANDNGICALVFDKGSSVPGSPTKKIYAFVSRKSQTNVYVSTNAGAAWSGVPGQPLTFMPQRASLATNGNLFIAYADAEGPWNNAGTGGVWRLNTRDGTWTAVTPMGNGYSYGGICVDRKNPNRVLASTINKYLGQGGGGYGDKLYLSTDGGAAWSDLGAARSAGGVTWLSSGNSIHWAGSVEFDPFDSARAFVISGNGLFRADNVNSSPLWEFDVKGLEETVPLNMISIRNGPVVSVVGDYDGSIYSNVETYGPVHAPSMGTTSGLAFAALRSNFIVRSGNGNAYIYYSTNSGKSWREFSSIPGGSGNGNVAVSADATAVLWCPSGSSTIYRTMNRGGSWSSCSGAGFNGAVPTADPVNPAKFYVYNPSTGGVYRSADNGVSFGLTAVISSGGSGLIRCPLDREGEIWIAGSWGLSRSTDSGSSFTALGSLTRANAVGFGKSAPGRSFPSVYIWGTVGGVTGLYRSTNQAVSWDRINDDSHEFGGPGNGNFVMGDMNIYGRVYMGTVGRGIIYGSIPLKLPPVASIASTSNRSDYPEPAAVTVTVTASDPDGSVTSIEIFKNGVSLGTSAVSPFSVTLTNLASGNYGLTAVAVDDDGLSSWTGLTIRVFFPVECGPQSVTITNDRITSVLLSAKPRSRKGPATNVSIDFSSIGFPAVGMSNSPPGSSNWSRVSQIPPGSPGGDRNIVVTAVDSSNSTGRQTVHLFVVDRLPPQKPTNLVATSGTGSIGLRWQASDETGISGYRISRWSDTEPVTVSFSSSPVWSDSSVRSGVIYHYSVTAVDTSSNESEPSIAVAANAGLTGLIQVRNNYVNFSASVSNPFMYVELLEKSSVEIDVFDTLGELVKRIAGGEFPAGAYEFAWDLAGKSVSSGIYLFSVKINSQKPVISKVMIVR